jgi:galactitol PTS system EIIA component
VRLALLQLKEDFVLVNFEAPDAQTVIEALAEKLYASGMVSVDYGGQTVARELKHPTGLPTSPFCIAFPHADSEGVNHSSLAMASLRQPVSFKNMADPDEELQVYLVLMLANKSPEEQIQTLRNLAILFGQPEKLEALRSQSTPEDAVAWLRSELGLD